MIFAKLTPETPRLLFLKWRMKMQNKVPKPTTLLIEIQYSELNGTV